jgi:ribosome-interacting GTPase 1
VVLNKIELLDPVDLQDRIEELERHTARPVLAVSAATSANLSKLLAAVWQELGVVEPG